MALARLHGVSTSYRTVLGERRDAAPDTLLAVLRAMGVPISRVVDAADLHRTGRAARAARVIEPVTVSWVGTPGALTITLADPPPTPSLVVEIDLATGETRRLEPVLAELAVVRSRVIDGTRRVTRRVPIGALPAGYHRVRVEAGAVSAAATVIAAPPACPGGRDRRRRWGFFVPLPTLRSARSVGAGDFTDLEALVRRTGERGGSIVGTLPFLAAFHADPSEPSPFLPASRLFWNELHVDFARAPELERSAEARRILASDGFAAEARAIGALDVVDAAREMALKRPLIDALATSLFESDERREALERFVSERPLSAEYAAFRAACERHKVPWRRWPARMRDGTIERSDYDEDSHRRHLYVQLLAADAISRVSDAARAGGTSLYLDFPVGVHPDGFDPWRERALHTEGISVGAPPDPLAPEGQDWSFPAIVPETSRLEGHRHFAACVRHHTRAAGVLRLDHIMGLHRLFWIPRGANARDGAYVRYPAEELYAVVCLEAGRTETMVLGEDLGTVPPAVRPAMARHGIRRMHVVQSELDAGSARPLRPDRHAVASLNTHDMPTFASWWGGKDLLLWSELGLLGDERLAAAESARARARDRLADLLSRARAVRRPRSPAAALTATLSELGASDAPIVLVNLEDLWLEERPQNVPGTMLESNWRRRIAHTIEELDEMPEAIAALEALDRARRGRDHECSGAKAEPAVSSLSYRPFEEIRLTPDDLHFLAEGTHADLHEKLGAHPIEKDGERGTHFAVWAPNARSVSVFGSFNGWDKRRHPLRPIDGAGVWVAFVPGVEVGAAYKFHVVSRTPRASGDKADPLAFRAERPPKTASIVDAREHAWGDAEWMSGRANHQRLDAPISIYELHVGSWMRAPEDPSRPLSYTELAARLVAYLVRTGFTHVELMPVMEHPYYGSWGYQVTGFFAATSRYGRPEELVALVDALHRAGIGVILDWVPSHFPTDAHGLAFFDGTHLYEHADPRRGFHPDWKSLIFNYGRHEVRSFLLSNVAYWLDRFHIDALRVDAVASMLYLDYSRKENEWLPNEHGGRENLDAISLLRQINELAGKRFPGALMIAEESTAWPMVTKPPYLGGLGFHLKWDMGWMHDTLKYFSMDPYFRSHHHNTLTFRQMYAHTENFVLALSHDEVVHGKRSLLSKMPGDWWQKFANLRALYGYMYGLPGKKLLFMGSELAPWKEWNHESALEWSLEDEPMHRGIQRWISDLNRLYREEPALHEGDCDPKGFEWIDCHDNQGSTLSFLRTSRKGETILVVCNFTPIVREEYTVGVPREGFWRELLNGDREIYGGSGVGNPAGVEASRAAMHGRPRSLRITLPPLSVVFWKAPVSGSGS